MPSRYVCVHAHFYQPPREDPLTGLIPPEIGAAPFQNWNERILAECYQPNAELRNFEAISFNLGPTLSSWLEQHARLTYGQIIAQDQRNVHRYGVGNGMAQSFNHTILPLTNRRDKITQIKWGIDDFEHRFGRKPLGMWLPETAVDLETLQILAEEGIQYTILAPWQAEGELADPTEPYRVKLDHGQTITVFFYDKDLSARVSFDPGATTNADLFVQNHLQERFSAEKYRRGAPQLILVASDGELYGHHQRQRDRFLARLLDGASSKVQIQPVYPALWLKTYPPRRTIQIRERTSWSCHHGVERWTGGCPCTPPGNTWKGALRGAFQHLAEMLDQIYYEEAIRFLADPWALRDRYIHVLLGKMDVSNLLFNFCGVAHQSHDLERISLLLEAQRERQRMFTSCGWFFDDFDRIEPKNNVAYAAQAVRLTRRATGIDLESQAMGELAHVISRRSGLRASQVFQAYLRRESARHGR